MGEIKILFKPEVEAYINNLVFELYQEKYFSNLESAIIYKDNIIDFIENNITIFPFRNTPIPLVTLGSKYIFYKKNNRIT